MKLIRFGAPGEEKPGIHINGTNYDLSAFYRDYDELFFADNGLADLAALLKMSAGKLPVVPEGTRLGPPGGPSFQNRMHRTELFQTREGNQCPDPQRADHLFQINHFL